MSDRPDAVDREFVEPEPDFAVEPEVDGVDEVPADRDGWADGWTAPNSSVPVADLIDDADGEASTETGGVEGTPTSGSFTAR